MPKIGLSIRRMAEYDFSYPWSKWGERHLIFLGYTVSNQHPPHARASTSQLTESAMHSNKHLLRTAGVPPWSLLSVPHQLYNNVLSLCGWRVLLKPSNRFLLTISIPRTALQAIITFMISYSNVMLITRSMGNVNADPVTLRVETKFNNEALLFLQCSSLIKKRIRCQSTPPQPDS